MSMSLVVQGHSCCLSDSADDSLSCSPHQAKQCCGTKTRQTISLINNINFSNITPKVFLLLYKSLNQNLCFVRGVTRVIEK